MPTDYLKINRKILIWLKENYPIKYRTLKRYLECQNIYEKEVKKGKSRDEAWKEAAKHWNTWAKELIRQRSFLEKTGEFRVTGGHFWAFDAKNKQTEKWIFESEVDFSLLNFKVKSREKCLNCPVISLPSFKYFIFPFRSNFSSTSFDFFADFDCCKFLGPTKFRKSIFHGTSFDNCAFIKDIDFAETNFYSFTKFSNCSFCSDLILFSNSTFHEDCRFENCQFLGNTKFDSTLYKGDVVFRDCHFLIVSFDGSTFKNVNFINIKFGVSSFSYSKIRSSTFYKNCFFQGKAFFFDFLVNGDCVFEKSHFHDSTLFRRSSFSFLSLYCLHFSNEADFSHIICKKGLSIDDVKFEYVPNFNVASFNAPPVLDNLKISQQLTSKSKFGPFSFRHVPEPLENAKDISRNFRALGKMAHEARDWLNEMEFFSQEIRTRRFGEDFPFPHALAQLFSAIDKLRAQWREFQLRRHFWPFKNTHEVLRHTKFRPSYDEHVFGPNAGRFWFGLIYEKFSNFGRSFMRPLTWWGLITIFFTILYILLAQDISKWSWWDAVYLSVRHALVVGGLVRTGHMQDVIKNMFGSLTSGIALIMLIQTVISAFFLFLFFLAVRNHFRIR